MLLVDSLFAGKSHRFIMLVCLMLVATIGFVDQITGYELSFSIFYLVPIGISSWYVGRRLGVLMSIVCSFTWFFVECQSGQLFSSFLVPLWNGVVRFGFFFITSNLLAALKERLIFEKTIARYDGLTGILNSRGFQEQANLVLDLAKRYGRPLSLGYLDIDNFKRVNDTQGHGAGDRVLQVTARELTRVLRRTDIIARIGGDEFVVLLPESDLAGAKTAFTKVRKHLLQKMLSGDWPVGFSIGVVCFLKDPPALEQIIRLADALMYRVKNSGKNNVEYESYPSGCKTEG